MMMNCGLIQYRRFSKKSFGPRLWHDVLFVNKNTHAPDLTLCIYKELGDREHLVSDVARFFTWLRRTLSGRVFIGVDSSCIPTRRHHCAAPHYSITYMCAVSASRMIAPNSGLHLSDQFNFAPFRLRRCAYLAPQNEMNPTHVHNWAYIGATSK